MVKDSMVLQEVFNDRIFSTGLWSPRSPDLSVCDICLWENLKGKVYRNTPRTAEALQNWDKECGCFDFGWRTSACFAGFLWRCEACLRVASDHFENFPWHWWVSFSFYHLVSCSVWTDGFKPQNEGGYFSSGSGHNFVAYFFQNWLTRACGKYKG
jgi:hypothetical protein